MTGQAHTPAVRSEIERELDEIVSNEEGMRFQGLAVVLARRRWPELIASERKNDLGLDAYASASLSPDKIAKGLACSITPELQKISDDAKKVKQHFPDVTVLLFSTPQKVSNPKKKEWAEKIQKDFGYELHVISREDIIASLMEPENTSLCSSFLGIDVAIDPQIADVVETIREAAAAEVATWAAKTQGPFIDLLAAQVDDAGRESSQTYSLIQLHEALTESRRLVLEAPAGRGKTTTLVQLADLQNGLEGTAFLVDLPAWTSSGVPILDFIAQSPQFQASGIDSSTLAKVRNAEHFSFLLNGWNEVTESNSVKASSALRELDRSFPAAGIIVATRTHHVRPPLPGALRLRLLQLTRRQRNAYLRDRLGDRARELGSQLDADAVLNEVTRTPLILSGVTLIFEAGAPIPTTKIGVLAAVVRLMEELPEHGGPLQSAPLSGSQRHYLGELATQMTAMGAVSTADADARAIVHRVAERLRQSHQITALPEPVEILHALSKHHVLERLEYPEVAFRFQHQQVQEHYAAIEIKRQLLELIARSGEDQRRDFTATYVNAPAWAEPLRMIAEAIGIQTDEATADRREVQAGRALVEMALSVDPVFASELARLCGTLVWREVGPTLTARLRSWFGVSDENHRNCALAAMLATGSDEFQDIVVPFLSGGEKELSLRTYRLRPELYLTSLGPKWRQIVSAWSEEVRTTFVSEILHNTFVPEILDFAIADKSVAVQQATAEALTWNGMDDEAARLMEAATAPAFDAIAQKMSPDLIPVAARARALATLQKAPEDPDPAGHLTTLLKLAELGDANIAPQLKETLNRLPDKITEAWALHAIQHALEILRLDESDWVSHWVATRVASGALWHDHWMAFVSTVPAELIETSVRRLESEDFQHSHFGGLIAVVAAGADATVAARVFASLRVLRTTIAAAPGQRHEFEWQIERQLEALFRALPFDVSVAGLLTALSEEQPAIDVELVGRVFTRVARHDADSVRGLDSGLKEQLRSYLKKSLGLVRQQNDFDGYLKANVASVLAQIGEPDDIDDLVTLVRADIERGKRSRAARAAGDRGPAANSMGQGPWLIRAIAELNSPRTDDVLLDLLQDAEYGRWVAEELPKLVIPPQAGAPFGNKVDYNSIWEARSGRRRRDPNEERRARFGAALRGHITRALDEYRGSCDAQPNSYILKELAKTLAALDGRGSTDLVLEIMALPGSGGGWQQADALESMLLAGATLPTEPVLAILDTVLAQAQRNGPQDGERWLVSRFLRICPYVDNPARGIQKIRDVIALPWVRSYELREVATAVGHSRVDEAFDLLRDLASEPARARELDDAWTNAVAALNTPAARNLLMSFVDPEIPGLPAAVTLNHQDVLAARIFDGAKGDPALEARLRELCALALPAANRRLLAKVMSWFGTSEALVAALDLMDDGAQPRVEYDTWQQLETAFVERKPYGQSPNTFTLAARASNQIRARLFEMAVRDERRKKSAFSLLGQIEEWRLEHGRPIGEPRHPAFGSTDPWPPVEPQ